MATRPAASTRARAEAQSLNLVFTSCRLTSSSASDHGCSTESSPWKAAGLAGCSSAVAPWLGLGLGLGLALALGLGVGIRVRVRVGPSPYPSPKPHLVRHGGHERRVQLALEVEPAQHA